MDATPYIPTTFGAVLIGALFASVLSGFTNLQTIIYYRCYRRDPVQIKLLVFSVWLLDNIHTAFIWSGTWFYFVDHYGDREKIDRIPWSIALTVILTALITVLVHCFLTHRIYLLSKKNLFMTVPVLVHQDWELIHECSDHIQNVRRIYLCTMIIRLNYESFELLKLHARWIFTLGLAVSSTVDVLISGFLVYFFNDILDKLLLYGLESGSLTCFGSIVSMLCWVLIPQNLIFLGLYVVIGKLYANSLFVTLNTRNSIREQDQERSVLYLEQRRLPLGTKSSDLEVNVETQTKVHYDVRSIGSSK
ncbi:hypothetical protein C8R46DRAFT_1196046 [Mycena filopes]|nr:hypothetical protein C8R46DRAFT_1196046 [Mycena filopes]